MLMRNVNGEGEKGGMRGEKKRKEKNRWKKKRGMMSDRRFGIDFYSFLAVGVCFFANGASVGNPASLFHTLFHI